MAHEIVLKYKDVPNQPTHLLTHKTMMLTVSEALQLPVFVQAQVVAGQSGLDRQITSAHIIDSPDADYEWGRPGVLLLTTGFGLKDNPERQETLIPKLIELGFAGLVISTGFYLPEIPLIIRQAADELSFPTIETPWNLMFIDILEAIFEQIVNRQYTLLQKATMIHERLTNLILQGGDLSDVAETLAKLLRHSITIEGAGGRMLAEGRSGTVDEARERSVQLGYTTPEVTKRLLESGTYKELLTTMRPVRVAPMPDLGMTMERIVAPIMVEREIHGYIWIISGSRPLTELDEMAIRHGATVAAFLMFKEQAVRQAEEKLRGDFFEQLLQGKDPTHSAILTEQALQLGYRLKESHQVLLIRATPIAGSTTRSFANIVDNWLRSQTYRALLVWRDEGLVVVIESRSLKSGKKLATKMVAGLSHPAQPMLIGLGCIFNSMSDTSSDATLQKSYEQAREAAAIGVGLGKQEGIITFEELGILHWLYHLPAEQRSQNSYMQHLDTLAAYDKLRETELIKTLETYLEHGGSLVETAKALYVHRNTLLHRVNRIEDLCGLELRDPIQRLNLHAAVKSYRLHQEP